MPKFWGLSSSLVILAVCLFFCVLYASVTAFVFFDVKRPVVTMDPAYRRIQSPTL